MPPPASVHPQYPPPTSLLDLPNFEYLANPDTCGSHEPVLAVVLVHSHPANVDVRNTARDHISSEMLADLGMRRVFLMGRAINAQKLYPAVHQEFIKQESAQHMDLVQGNFVEHYRNLTYKHVMGLAWVTKYCSQAKFVIKIDDDIAVDVHQIRQMILYKYAKIRNELLGLVQIDAHPLRTNESKWQVTREEFAGNVYPPFLSGWCYIAPMDVVQKLVIFAHTLPYFWIDDVFITGILADKLGIAREGINNKYTIHNSHLRCCADPQYDSYKYECDFLAGPTGGDLSLLAKVLDQFRHCYRRGCELRSGKELLARTCVTTREDLYVGKGVGEVIAIA